MALPEEFGPNPSSPAGQLESTGAFALGLTRLSGWRRQVARWGIVALLAAPCVTVIIDHIVR